MSNNKPLECEFNPHTISQINNHRLTCPNERLVVVLLWLWWPNKLIIISTTANIIIPADDDDDDKFFWSYPCVQSAESFVLKGKKLR